MAAATDTEMEGKRPWHTAYEPGDCEAAPDILEAAALRIVSCPTDAEAREAVLKAAAALDRVADARCYTEMQAFDLVEGLPKRWAGVLSKAKKAVASPEAAVSKKEMERARCDKVKSWGLLDLLKRIRRLAAEAVAKPAVQDELVSRASQIPCSTLPETDRLQELANHMTVASVKRLAPRSGPMADAAAGPGVERVVDGVYVVRAYAKELGIDPARVFERCGPAGATLGPGD